MKVDAAKSLLSEAGLKITPQRIAVVRAIADRRDHPTTEQLYEKLTRKHPGITQATVYNILDILVENGLVNRVFTPEGKQRFDPIITNHGHIYCHKSKEIVDFFDDELNDLITSYLKKKRINNLRIKYISLLISGEKLDDSRDVNIK